MCGQHRSPEGLMPRIPIAISIAALALVAFAYPALTSLVR
jgi:hypothetical protein